MDEEFSRSPHMSCERPSSPLPNFDQESSQSNQIGPSKYGKDHEMDVDENDDSDLDIRRKKDDRKKKRGRKPKLVTESDDNEEIYCICRTSDTDRFMICCDKCEEWFHGDCVKITQSFSKKVQNYYCPLCREKDSSLEIKLKESQKPKKEKIRIEPTLEKDNIFEKENNLPFDRFKHVKIDSDEEKDNYSPDDEEDDDYDDDDEFKVRKTEKSVTKRSRGRPKKSDDKAKSKAKQRGRKKGQSAKTKEPKGKGKGRGRRKNVDKKSHEHHRRGRHKVQSDDSQDELKANIPRHCYGPGCVYAARKGSKYCSDECGMQLATKRMLEILPQRISEWRKIPCAADQLSWKEVEEIRREQNHATTILADIDRKQLELDSIVEQGKSSIPYSEEESSAIVDNEPDSDYVIHCITCSQEVSLKLSLKHMERCFNKVESQTSFCSTVQTKIEGQKVFCDVYNPHQRTYCKRLRVLCPEHSKETRINEDEVCGCPLRSAEDPFTDHSESNSFCRILRKKCIRHYGWEKSRQAVLDAQRIQQWLKLDELLEREQKARQRMATRHGVVPLLLHRTTLPSD